MTITNREAGEHVARRTPFRTGNATLTGAWFDSAHRPGMGRLAEYYRHTLSYLLDVATQDDPYHVRGPVFVVKSYDTPIAWWSYTYGWQAPADKYSVTTSRHQGIVNRAVDPALI